MFRFVGSRASGVFCLAWLLLAASGSHSLGFEPAWQVGVSKVDITPKSPARLSGYASRTGPSVGIEDRLSARALVLVPEMADGAASHADSSQAEPLVIVSIDAIGISAVMTERIVGQISPALGIPRARIVLCTTHSHTAPHMEGVIPNLFGIPLEGEEAETSIAYRELVENQVIAAIRNAVANLQPGHVEYGLGRAEFAINRRMVKNQQWIGFGTVDDGPVDRSVRVLKVKDTAGTPIAVAYQYACHCTSISPELNRISGDWAGLSASKLESLLPGCVALPIIGCGADANPNPRGTMENAVAHGDVMADAVRQVLDKPMSALPHPTQTAFTLVALASERPTANQLRDMQGSASAHERNFANTWLELLTRKDRIPESYPAPIHFWAFGDQLAWVFMSGEVVVDYQIRFERELSQFANVWVAGYVDDVFAYVASERIRREGGYEASESMLYYGQPGRWVSGTEDAIVDRVLQMTRQKHPADQPMSPQESLASIQVPKGWTIELVASEPLVMDPVNIAFGPDGTVWVVEMGDYPSGGGRSGCIKALKDTNGDGTLDSSTVFLDQLDYPAGVYPWRDGVVVACAPEVFFAKDTDGDGVADLRVPLLTGFPEGNPQHRVYGFTYGMEHRLFFGTGGSADQIVATGQNALPADSRFAPARRQPQEHRVSGFDISLDPDSGTMQLETGDTQYIRATDDFATWFGNENSLPMFHFVVDQQWLALGGKSPYRRAQLMTDPPSVPPVYPISQQADRFNDLFTVNRFTSACSTIVNRGPGQGAGMQGFAVVCEPVHNLVARFQLERRGATWAAIRTPEDAKSDWVRSSDPWFRPVRIENAPDGSLWILDMYRYVIEHPEWIPDEWQRRINLRAGDDRGRIYRVRRKDFQTMPTVDMTKLADIELVQELSSPSSSRADMAQQLVVARQRDRGLEPNALAAIRHDVFASNEARVRMRLFASLIAMGEASQADFLDRLADPDPRVVEATVKWLDRCPDPQGLRNQLWQTVRPEWIQESASLALAVSLAASGATQPQADRMAQALASHADDPWMVECTSLLAPQSVDALVDAFLAREQNGLAALKEQSLIEKLIPRTSPETRAKLLATVLQASGQRPAWHYLLARQFSAAPSQEFALESVEKVLDDARQALGRRSEESAAVQRAALDLLSSRMGESWSPDHALLLQSLKQQRSEDMDRDTARRLARLGPASTEKLIGAWSDLSPPSRTAILGEWTNKSEWINPLLDALQSGNIPPTDIDAATLQRLRQLPEGVESKRVLEVFGPPPGADRSAVVQGALAKWPARSDMELGKIAYQKHCAVCHEPRTMGEQSEPAVGPNLRGLVHWSNDAWMTAILDPNRSVEEKYWAFQARTEDGELITGLKLREDATTIEWVSSAGRVDRIEKSQLAEIRASRQSLMPDGFEQIVAPEDLAGIITYLRAASQ